MNGNSIPSSSPHFLVSSTGSDPNPFRYGGKFGYYTDPNTGLQLAGARCYSPNAFRWLGRDPIHYKGGDNLYAYVTGNPVKYVDPSGLYTCTYHIGAHRLVCNPINPGHPLIDTTAVVSGNNDAPGTPTSSCSDCKDNPQRTDKLFRGPIPVGYYTIKPNFNNKRKLVPDLSNDMKGRQADTFRMHGCTNLATCSFGCIAIQPWTFISNTLSLEEGQNILEVIP